tara:strand:+ start:596 stop:886 length:291 start_codon:yes stop_codon:yes gene_type:complete
MLKSDILNTLTRKHNNINPDDIENFFDLFIKSISLSLKQGQNIEIRGFGTITKKVNKEKFVRNPKTNEKIFKNETFKLHFKIGKTLHKKLNSINNE